MILRFCISIPTYNNSGTIKGVVSRCLRETTFPIVVIDDGSDVPVSTLLDDDARVTILRHTANRGKGHALKTAFAYSLSQAYTHVITLDADGQHAPEDIAVLVNEALVHPWDMLVGDRRMDPVTTPKISQFGRKFSNFWLWYQTGSYVKDTQSGFRVYPMFHMQNITCITQKFDFELEVLARLLWRKIIVRTVPISVKYFDADERVSHFHKIHDNVRIAGMNIVMIAWSLIRYQARLHQVGLSVILGGVIGVLANHWVGALALVALVCFMARSNGVVMFMAAIMQMYLSSTHGVFLSFLIMGCLSGLFFVLSAGNTGKKNETSTWTGEMRGGRIGNALIAGINRLLGQHISYLCMFFVVPYFYFFAPRARSASQQLGRVVFSSSSYLRRLFFPLEHFFIFSLLMLDRLYQSQFSQPKFRYTDVGGHHLIKARDRAKGSVMVTAHFGALDVVAKATQQFDLFDKLVRAEFVAEADVTMESVLRRKDKKTSELPIVSQKEQSILYLRQLIEAGKSIVMMGDRPLGANYELVLFMGKLAAFDTTPYRIAQSCGTNILYCFGIKRSMWDYQLVAIDGGCFSEKKVDKVEAIYLATQSFATSLELQVREFPRQWANFFPFWAEAPRPPATSFAKKTREKNQVGGQPVVSRVTL